MLDAFCLHHRDTPNVGDLASTPHDYFDFGNSKLAAFGSKIPPTKRLIMGGGLTWNACVRNALNKAQNAKHTVIWGVGISRAGVKSDEFKEMQKACSLISSRCYGQERRGARYVPCASAMSEHFDTAPAPTREVVMFSHSGYSDTIRRVEGVPEISNINVSLKDAIHFIASGETVVTSSYHGTFWALLLGRRVICVPFSRKFRFFKEPPSMATPDDWPEYIGKANRVSGGLDEARSLNRAFYDDVMNL